MPFCSKCGNEISEKDTFCSKCGIGIKWVPHVDVVGQMILAALPTVVTPLYACKKIKKTKRGAVMIGILYGIIMIQYTLMYAINWIYGIMGWQYGSEINALVVWIPYVMSLAISIYGLALIIVPVYFVRKWTLEYNLKLT